MDGEFHQKVGFSADQRVVSQEQAGGGEQPQTANFFGLSGAERSDAYTATLDMVRYDKQTGLVPVVVQSSSDGEVLMMAYANREALKRTYGTGQAWFWSRSRQAYWRKGETSGNVLHVRDIRLDCDGDTVLFLVDAEGPACHTGEVSCFYRRMTYKDNLPGPQSQFAGDDTGIVAEEAVLIEDMEDDEEISEGTSWRVASVSGNFDRQGIVPPRPGDGSVDVPRDEDRFRERSGGTVGQVSESLETLMDLWTTIEKRYEERPNGSYTTYLFEQGIDKIAKKVGEEAVEVVIAGKNAIQAGDAGTVELAQESADLLYHLFVLWKQADISWQQILDVLQQRER